MIPTVVMDKTGFQPGTHTILVLIFFWVISCGEVPTSSQESLIEPIPTPVNIENLINDVGEATASLSSFHFRLGHNEGGTIVAPNLMVTEVSGDVVNPNKLYIEFSGTLGSFTLKSSIKSVDDETFMMNPLTDRWENISGEISPMAFFDPHAGIGSIIKRVQNPILLSHEQATIVVGGSLPSDALRSLLGNVDGNTILDVKLSIDVHTSLLIKAVLSGPLIPMENDGVIRTITLSEFNQVMDIEHLE